MSILLATSRTQTPIWVMGIMLATIACGAILVWKGRISSRVAQPLRVSSPNDAAPAWIGLGVMLMFYIYTPVVAAVLFANGSSATTRGATPATSQPIDLAVAIGSMVVTYLLAMLSAVAIHAYMRTPTRKLFGMRVPSLAQWRLLFNFSLTAIPLTYIVATLTTFLLDRLGWAHEMSHPMLQWMSQLRERPALRLLAIASATFAAPLFEEWFFRGHLQTGLSGLLRGRWPAILITSTIFASLHPWWTIPAIFFLSVCLGWVYERTGNIWIPVALHVLFNVISTTLFLSGLTGG